MTLLREVAKKLVTGNWYADIAFFDSERVSFLRYSHSNKGTLHFDKQVSETKDYDYGRDSNGSIIFNDSQSFFEPTAQDAKINPDLLSPQQRYDNLLEEFEQYKLESIKWSVEDFMEFPGYRITRERAQEALEKMIARHDADHGITWSEVEYYLGEYGDEIID